MTIQINTDKNINGDERQHDFFSAQIADELSRFDSKITRIEVHLKDENGKTDGYNTLSCLLEARIEGKQPIVVTAQEDTVELAITSAVKKIKASLKTIIGRIQEH